MLFHALQPSQKMSLLQDVIFSPLARRFCDSKKSGLMQKIEKGNAVNAIGALDQTILQQ
jgi:hypothetical protein